MAQQKKGFVARLLEGKERSEEYARTTLPTNRFQLFFDIFKGNFGKLVKANLLTLLFFIPLFAVIILMNFLQEANGITYPFGANLGIGYPASPNLQGVSEMIVMQTELIMFALVILTSFVSAVGLAGGMYVIRNMVWTEGVFVTSDFWHGVKLNYKNALQTALFFSTVLLVTKSFVNFADFTIAMNVDVEGFSKVWIVISKILSYAVLAIGTMMSFWMISISVNYTQPFFKLLKNAFLIAIGTFPQTIFFGVIALAPFIPLFFEGEFATALGIFAVAVFGAAFALLVWLDFSQWVFDKYINPKIEGARVARGLYNKDGTKAGIDESESALEYERAILTLGKSQLASRPMKPIDDELEVYELPASFSREDLKKLRESKKQIFDDTEAYVEEHKNDTKYVEYNKAFAERELALQDETDAKGKKKKRKPPKMLGQ